MWRLVVSGLALVLVLLVGCQKNEGPVIGKRPTVGEAPRPFSPADSSKGDWEDPRLRELRKQR
jgi:hypothetical protein